LAPIFTQSLSQQQSQSDDGSKKRPIDIEVSSQQQGPSKRAKVVQAMPLAEILRPTTLDEFVGQPHLTNPNSLFMQSASKGVVGSIIFWGPPGYMIANRVALSWINFTDALPPCRCGKTTLARLIANQSGAVFKELSATVVGVNEVRTIFADAKKTASATGR
jgi:putative ATPase